MYEGRNERTLHTRNASYHQDEYWDNKIPPNIWTVVNIAKSYKLTDDRKAHSYCKNLDITKLISYVLVMHICINCSYYTKFHD